MALSHRWLRRPFTADGAKPSRGRRVKSYGAGQYLGCPGCGRLLKIEWAVRSLVCSCGTRVPVAPSDGNDA